MIKNNKWESLVWIIIWVFILSFIILWVTNLLINSNTILETYDNKRIINLLKNNTENIIKNVGYYEQLFDNTHEPILLIDSWLAGSKKLFHLKALLTKPSSGPCSNTQTLFSNHECTILNSSSLYILFCCKTICASNKGIIVG